jgi:hypothetical protein
MHPEYLRLVRANRNSRSLPNRVALFAFNLRRSKNRAQLFREGKIHSTFSKKHRISENALESDL